FHTDADGVVHTLVDGEDVTTALREPAIGELASSVATIPALRAQLVAKQQEYGRQGGVIMEGRDIQTVVFPNADLKIFLTASAAERARRRCDELQARGESIAYQTVLDEVETRDRRDAEREASPLRAADDAILVDTDGRTVDQVVEVLVELIRTWRAQRAALTLPTQKER
ncbi:MAG TPA: (d)CMP kinase, partial [Armatimonadota bacterium]